MTERYTTEEMNAALTAVQERRLTTPDGVDELRASGLPAGIMPYALSIAEHNLEKWAEQGVKVGVPDAFAAGWMDGLLVGLALRDIRKPDPYADTRPGLSPELRVFLAAMIALVILALVIIL